MSEKDIALVVGAGPGLGAALARTFAGAGMAVAAARRDPAKLQPLMEELGDGARAYACDTTEETDVAHLFEGIKTDMGEPAVVVYNAGAFVKKGILESTADELERCWRVGCLGGFLVGQRAARIMVPRGRGTILFTGATASLRGGAGFHNLAVPKFGLRA
ncbi:MAG: SDR family NAD(P)-dependent oxidoreductase, partial [Rhodospirillales bacterium]